MLVWGALIGGCRGELPGDEWIGTPLSERPMATPSTLTSAAALEIPPPPPEEPRPTPMPRGAALPPDPGAAPIVPSDADTRRRLAEAEALARRGEVDAALAVLDGAADRAPGDLAIPLAQGRILRHANRPAQAVSAWRRALALAPDNPDALYGLTADLLALDRVDEALAPSERLAAARPDDPAVARLRAVLLERAGDADGSLAARAALARGDDPSARRALGDALARQGRHAEAADAFAAAAARQPDDPDLALRLGTALAFAGRLDAAEQALVKSTSLAPGAATGWQQLARVREQRGDRAGAMAALQALIDNVEGVDADAVRARIERLAAADGAE